MKIPALITLLAVVSLSVPSVGQAASMNPVCTLSATSGTRGTFETDKVAKMLVDKNIPLTLHWSSENALQATSNGQSVEIEGQTTVTPTQTTTYSYTFMSGSKKTTCSLIAVIGHADIDFYSLTSITPKPTLRGTASGLTSVRLDIKKDVFSDTMIYTKSVKVKNGTWELKVPVALEDGTYQVDLRGSDDLGTNYIQTGTLTVTAAGIPSVTVSTQVPSDAAVATGSVAPIAIARITNTSKGIATITGVWVRLVGNMPPLGVIGLSMKADNGEANGASGMMEGYTPFKDGLANIPEQMTLDPGETRVLTMEVKFSKNAAYKGKQARIDIYQYSTSAGVNGTFAVKGTTYTVK